MSSCQNFKQKIEEFKKKTEELCFALEQYKNGQKEHLEIFEEGHEKLEKEIEEFRENEYAERVKEMIKRLIYVFEEESLKFDEKGRIISFDIIDDRINSNYFPNLIKETKNYIILELERVNIKHIDNLEIINGSLDCSNNTTIESFKILKKVGDFLNLYGSDVKLFSNLEEVGTSLNIQGCYYINTIENFLRTFPKLKKIGKDIAGMSIWLSVEQEINFKSDLERLRDEGKLEFNGKVGRL